MIKDQVDVYSGSRIRFCGQGCKKRLSEFLVTCKNSGSPFRWRHHADGALIHRPGMSLRQAQRPGMQSSTRPVL